MKILKSIGEYEEYNREKLRQSLLNASASIVVTNEIIKKIESEIRDEITSTDIYKHAFDILNEKERVTAMKYSVKRSIFELGPTGFPFEKYIAQVLEAKGYKTIVGKTLKGKCVSHEIDVIAYDQNELLLIEVKFRNKNSLKVDTKTALYVKARWDDLKDTKVKIDDNKSMSPTKFILAVNTDFTQNAINYADCVGLELISWDHPLKGSLFKFVNETGQHPISVITELNQSQKNTLIKRGYITLNQILNNTKILDEIGIAKSKKEMIITESRKICNTC